MHTQFWFIYTLSNRSNTGLLLTQTLFDIIMKHMKETQLSYSDYLGISTYLMKHRAFNLYFGKSIASDARGPGSNPVIDNYLALTFEKSNISKKILGLAHFKQQKRSPRHSNNLLRHLFFQSIFNLLV